jgi:hypothetical protein
MAGGRLEGKESAMRIRTWKMLATVGALALLAGAAYPRIAEHLASAPTAEALAAREIGTAEAAVKREQPRLKSRVGIARVCEQGWQQLRSAMRDGGAAAPEADAAIQSARAAWGPNEVYVPLYAHRGKVAGRRVWVLGFAWGTRSFPEPLGHYRVFIVDSAAPSPVLSQVSCG